MKILHVITRLILGGAQQNTVMSCRAQVEAGHEVHLAYGPIHGPEGSLLSEARTSGATLHEVSAMVRALRPLQDGRCYLALRRLVRDLRPDLVHSHSSKAGIVARAAAWAERQHVPNAPAERESKPDHATAPAGRSLALPRVLHTVHGLPFHDRQNPLVHRLYVGLERWAARRCDHLVAITPAMVEAFAHQQIAPVDRFTVIPSGVDTHAFTPRPDRREQIRRRLNIPAGARVVGHVGRLDPLKGHADLMDQLPRLREAAGPDRDVVLLYVGDGYHRAQLEQHPEAAAGRVVFTGLVSLNQVPDYLSAMDVMALPSYQEGQSRTLCEALLCGVPIVGYDVGGIGSVCLDRVTGRLVPVGDRAALGDALIDLLDRPAYGAQLADAGRRHVLQHFSAEAMNRGLLTLYDRLVTPPAAG